jgi:epoxyqueuosine reductase
MRAAWLLAIVSAALQSLHGLSMGCRMTAATHTTWIAETFPELARLPEWLSAGYGGQMNYLADPRRESVVSILQGARSLIVCALVYNTAWPHTGETAAAHAAGASRTSHRQETEKADAPRGWISRYAWGDDYHRVVGERLDRLVAAMRAGIAGPFEARPYVDTGPLSERVAAKHAGLGWLGKNTCLIHPEIGSWFFLGVIVTTLELAPTLGPEGVLGDEPQPDLCGQCTLCLDACPTGAFVEAGVMDARRCISYLTIEHRGSLPEELRAAMGAHVYGCDICQDVCPYNHNAPVTEMVEFAPRRLVEKGEDRNSKIEIRPENSATDAASAPTDLFAPALEWLASLSEEEYRRVFRGSAMKRAKYQGLVRNACVALGNSARGLAPPARERAVALLSRLQASPDAVIAEHAAWALGRLSGA